MPALKIFVTFALAMMVVGCGGSSGTVVQTPTAVPSGGMSAAPPCVNGTVASYLGTSCSQGSGTVVYHWLSYGCSSTPPSICAGLGVNGSGLQMEMDPNGPYTILIGRTTLWNVVAGQGVDVAIGGTVYGATGNSNWPHFNGLRGQTGNGTEENITTVGCASSGNCLNVNNGVSDIPCNSQSPAANCTEQPTIGPYSNYRATFNAASAQNPYTLTIEIKLNGNAGSATLYSVGTHLTP